MADPLSITASIFGIVTLGFQVAKGLYQIADVIGSTNLGDGMLLYRGNSAFLHSDRSFAIH